MQLVTLAQARSHLRSDTDADDADLQLKIEAASELVMDYLGDGAEAFTDSAGDVYEDSNGLAQDVPVRVQQATLVTVNWLYKERDGSNEHAVDTKFGYGYTLPKGAIALLYSMRLPVIG
jgi:hypothetical protein